MGGSDRVEGQKRPRSVDGPTGYLCLAAILTMGCLNVNKTTTSKRNFTFSDVSKE
jgi:hypothetical protein